MKRGGPSNKSKVILSRLVTLYEHLDRLYNIPKPRTEDVDMMIKALHIRIESEKKKLSK